MLVVVMLEVLLVVAMPLPAGALTVQVVRAKLEVVLLEVMLVVALWLKTRN